MSDTTKKEFWEVIYFHTDEKIVQKHCRVDLNSRSDPLTCWL